MRLVLPIISILAVANGELETTITNNNSLPDSNTTINSEKNEGVWGMLSKTLKAVGVTEQRRNLIAGFLHHSRKLQSNIADDTTCAPSKDMSIKWFVPTVSPAPSIREADAAPTALPTAPRTNHPTQSPSSAPTETVECFVEVC